MQPILYSILAFENELLYVYTWWLCCSWDDSTNIHVPNIPHVTDAHARTSHQRTHNETCKSEFTSDFLLDSLEVLVKVRKSKAATSVCSKSGMLVNVNR